MSSAGTLASTSSIPKPTHTLNCAPHAQQRSPTVLYPPALYAHCRSPPCAPCAPSGYCRPSAYAVRIMSLLDVYICCAQSSASPRDDSVVSLMATRQCGRIQSAVTRASDRCFPIPTSVQLARSLPSIPFRLILVRLNGMVLRRSSHLKALANPADNSRAVRGTTSKRQRTANSDPSTGTEDTAPASSCPKSLVNLAENSRVVRGTACKHKQTANAPGIETIDAAPAAPKRPKLRGTLSRFVMLPLNVLYEVSSLFYRCCFAGRFTVISRRFSAS
jgi:hypothetical protein